MSEEEAIKIIEKLEKYISLEMLDMNKSKELSDLFAKSICAFQVIKNTLNKEKEKNKAYQKLLKHNEFRRKIETCMTHNMPENAEIICMIREDFEKNFGNDYISKDKIKEIFNKYDEQSKFKNIYWYEIKKDLQELLEE